MSRLHDGHRSRMYERFKTCGLDGFSKHELAEILLYSLIPRRNTNEIAHRLISELGDINDILDAPIERLEAVPGIGRSSAISIRFFGEIVRHYMRGCAKQGTPIESTEHVAMLLSGFARGKQRESLFVLSADAKNRLLGIEEIMVGAKGFVSFENSDVVDAAKRSGATFIILAHNHTNGNAVPSAEDVACTVRLKQLLEELNIGLIDHIVLADGDYVSMRDSGFI